MTENVSQNEERRLPRVKPATDIIEKEDGFYIYVDMPGVEKKDLVIDLNEDELKVSGKADYEMPEGRKLAHAIRHCRTFGSVPWAWEEGTSTRWTSGSSSTRWTMAGRDRFFIWITSNSPWCALQLPPQQEARRKNKI